MTTPKKFVRGDLVLVKFPEYGYWPAKITTVNKNGYRRFICFGDNSRGNAHVKDITHYDDSFKMKHISQISVDKYPELSEALDQISVESRTRNRNENNKKDPVNQSNVKDENGIKVENGTIVIDDDGSLENSSFSSNTRNSSTTNHQICRKCSHDAGTINKNKTNGATEFSINTNGPGFNAENNVKIRVDIEIPMDTFNQVAPEVFAGLARCRSSSVITQPIAKQMVNCPEGDRKLFVGGLAYHATNDDLVEYFEKFGVVQNADVPKEKMTGKSKGFAFVLFKTPEGLANATVKTSHVINGRVCKVERANKKPGKVYVGKLPATGVEKCDIQEYFEEYGNVTEITRPFDRSKNEPKNFCFVNFDNEDIAKNLVERGTCTIKGHSMQIKEGRGCYEAQRLAPRGYCGFYGWAGTSQSCRGSEFGAGGRMEREFGRDEMGGGYGDGMGGGYGDGMGGGYGDGMGGSYGDWMGGGYGGGWGRGYGGGMGEGYEGGMGGGYEGGMMDRDAGGSGMGSGYGAGRKRKGGKQGGREMYQ